MLFGDISIFLIQRKAEAFRWIKKYLDVTKQHVYNPFGNNTNYFTVTGYAKEIQQMN